jgi:hypothetical protein
MRSYIVPGVGIVHCEGRGEGDGEHADGFDREVPAAEERRAQANQPLSRRRRFICGCHARSEVVRHARPPSAAALSRAAARP